MGRMGALPPAPVSGSGQTGAVSIGEELFEERRRRRRAGDPRLSLEGRELFRHMTPATWSMSSKPASMTSPRPTHS